MLGEGQSSAWGRPASSWSLQLDCLSSDCCFCYYLVVRSWRQISEQDISPLCAFIFSTVSGDKYPQLRVQALSLVPAYSEYSSVRVDCWRSSSIFQMFLATGSSQEEGKIFWFILLSSLFFSLCWNKLCGVYLLSSFFSPERAKCR